MLKPSFFNKQNLTPKQKAVLSYWQEMKGMYINEPEDVTKDGKTIEKQPFEESEYQQLMDFANNDELLEYYMWTQVLDALSLSNTCAQGYYSDIISFTQVITFGPPCAIGQQWQWPKFTDHKHEYYSWRLGKTITYQQGSLLFSFYVEEFFSSVIQAIMLNVYMDEVASPLSSQKLLEGVFSLDKKISNFMDNLDGPVKTVFGFMEQGFVEKQFSEGKEQHIYDAEQNMRRLLQPLTVFNYKVQNDKIDICRSRTIEILNQAKRNCCA